MNKKLDKSWDPIWEKIFSENPWGKYPSESLIQFIARNFYKLKRSDINILEVGCGPGSNIWYLSREKFNAFGIDGSETAILQAEERLKSENLSANFKVGDIVNLPYNDSVFDAVLDVECLYANDIKNSNKILKEISRVLKNEGLFYSRTLSDKIYIGQNRIELGEKSYTDISDGPLKGRGFARLMSKKDINDLYGNYFDIISIDTLNYTIYNNQSEINEFIIIARKKKNERK
jgi:ubiquinone/menaquinone biosynthesis C-methylase UbiE